MTVGRLIVTADLHGSYKTWQAVRSMVGQNDILVVAGDLFDTRYGRSTPDFNPRTIRDEAAALGNRFRYVYGNCDVPAFCPGYRYALEFTHSGVDILLVHGHAPILNRPRHTALVIQGHTHVPKLEKTEEFVLFNPGSPAVPRVNLRTYGIIENNRITLLDFKTNTPLAWLDL